MAIKVCQVTSLHPYYDRRIFERGGKSLTKKYEVYIVAPNTETRVEDGVNIVGVPLPTINQRFKRYLQLRKLLKSLYDIDADVYHFHDPELMGVGLKLKKRGKKIIFDSHEDVLNQVQNKEFIPKPLRRIAAKIYAIYEKHCLKQYDALVSVTGFIVDRLKKINPNTYQITNYPIYENRDIKERQWDRTVCFTGLLNRTWMLNEIISILPQINAKMFMAGFYATEDYLNELKALPGWENVEFMGRRTHEEVLEVYNRVSVGIAIESYENPNAGFRVGSLGCTKIPDYMASGLPVVVSNSEVWGGVISKYKCGIAVENPKDANEIAAAIKYLLDHPDEAREMGIRGMEAVKTEFNWDTQEKILLKMYEEILSK